MSPQQQQKGRLKRDCGERSKGERHEQEAVYRRGQSTGLNVCLCTKHRTKYILCVKETPLEKNPVL